MLSIQLVVSYPHTYTIPQPSVSGDKELGSDGHIGVVPPNAAGSGMPATGVPEEGAVGDTEPERLRLAAYQT